MESECSICSLEVFFGVTPRGCMMHGFHTLCMEAYISERDRLRGPGTHIRCPGCIMGSCRELVQWTRVELILESPQSPLMEALAVPEIEHQEENLLIYQPLQSPALFMVSPVEVHIQPPTSEPGDPILIHQEENILLNEASSEQGLQGSIQEWVQQNLNGTAEHFRLTPPPPSESVSPWEDTEEPGMPPSPSPSSRSSNSMSSTCSSGSTSSSGTISTQSTSSAQSTLTSSSSGNTQISVSSQSTRSSLGHRRAPKKRQTKGRSSQSQDKAPHYLTCEICQKVFKSSSAKSQHLQTHRGPVACGWCGRSYSYKGGLRRHQKDKHQDMLK